MIATSQKWKDYSEEIGVFHIKAVIDNGTSMNLTDADFMQGSISITDSVSGMSEFTVGAVITNTFNGTLNNFDGKFNNYTLAGARLTVQLGIIYEDTTEEWIDRGTYTLEKPTSLGSTINIVGYDDMDKLNKFYAGKKLSGNNLFTQTGATYDYWKDISGNNVSKAGGFYSTYISVNGSTEYETNAPADSYVVFYDQYFMFLSAVRPTSGVVKSHTSARYAVISGYANEMSYYYFRTFKGSAVTNMSERLSASYFAKALCDYCDVDYDSDFWGLTDYVVLPGIFERNESTTYRELLSLLVQISGGYARMNPVGNLEVKAFKKYEPGDVDFTLSKIKSLNVYVDDITITGVRVYRYNTVYESTYEQYGSDGYVIAIQDNPMVSSSINLPTTPAVIAQRVGLLLNGLTFRPFEASIFGDPSFEAGDVVELEDYLGNTHISTITSLTYNLNQSESLECNAEYPEQNIQDFSNPQTQTIQQAISATKDDVFANGINVNDQIQLNPNGELSTTGSATIGGDISLGGNISIGGSLTINNETLADFVVEEGTWGSNGWYRKWNSGKAECFGFASITTAITSTYGNGYYTTSSATFPTGLFAEAPIVNITMEKSQGLLFASIYSKTAASVSFYIGSLASESSASVTFNVSAIGRWE